ncbi:MAG: extracellular solute-binding protein [Planctomycetes bacterium]|nr:extracellular solute-binding protein [Planctomycetota bacterium]
MPWFEDHAWIDPVLESFERANPGIRVEKVRATLEEETLRTLIAAGEPPDVFAISYEALASYAAARVLEPLDAHLARAGFRADEYFPVTLEALRLDGRQYGLPKDCTPYVLYYDRDAFAAAGLAVPDARWSWDDLARAARRLTERDAGGGVTRFGLRINYWAQALLPWVWQAGGDLLDASGRPRLDQAAWRNAFAFLYALHEEGVVPRTSRMDFQGSPRISFARGTVAMEGPAGRWLVRSLREQAPDKRYDVAPLPRGPDGARATALAMSAYCVAAASPHKEAAVRLLLHLAGPEGARLMGRLGVALPALRGVAEEVLAAGRGPPSDRVFLDELAHARVGPVHPRHAELKQAVRDAAEACFLAARPAPPAQALAAAQAAVDAIASRAHQASDRRAVPWAAVLGVPALLWLAAIGLLVRLQRGGPRLLRGERFAALGFLAPWLVGFSAFVLFPVLAVFALSCTDWNALAPIGEARLAGLANYERLLADPLVAQSARVTLYYVVLALPAQLLVSLGLALLLRRAGGWHGLLRTVIYLPSLVAGVALSVLWARLFDAHGGLLNDLLALLGVRGPDWLQDGRTVVPSFVLMSLWYVGGTVMVFLAGLTQVRSDLLEAARLDGAGPWRRFWHVTLPALAPIVVFNAITLLIGSFQVFTQSFLLTSGGPDNQSLFFVLLLYRTAFRYQEMGYACAMAVLLFVVVGALTALLLATSRRVLAGRFAT